MEGAYLLIGNVPYVNADKKVVHGILVSALDLSGDKTIKPQNHVVFWVGDYPCDSNGSQMENLINEKNKNLQIRAGIIANFSFSQKPGPQGYADYCEKMRTYIKILEGQARALDPNATAQTFHVTDSDDQESVFCYLDTATSRAGISAVNDKLKNGKIAIVGLGGTGAYVLDLVAKTPITEIHLFDGDDFFQHNAFRSPGAPSKDDLLKKQKKVQWFSEIYSRMRKNIFPHSQFINEDNVSELKQMEFVFLCIEGTHKKAIVEYLIGNKIPFVDVGIGMYVQNGSLSGNSRVTFVSPAFQEHVARRINFGEDNEDDYSQNIQIADMNALNAALAVIKWKKIRGFYVDFGHENNITYGISTNALTNDEIPDENNDD